MRHAHFSKEILQFSREITCFHCFEYYMRLHALKYVASLKGFLRPNRGFLAIGVSNHIGPKLTNLIPHPGFQGAQTRADPGVPD
jgi:hypothetical protein